MSEQNILNPTVGSVLNPTYSIPHRDPQIIARWQARSGKPFSRYMMARGLVFQMHWEKVLFSTYLSLRQWFRQYERDFFSFFDAQDGRYYSGQFLDEPQFEHVANNQVNISATFVVIPTLPQFLYPSNWGGDSVFLEERDGFGGDLVKLTGNWDRRDKNYVLWSEQFDNAAWVPAGGTTVTANNAVDPNGGNAADTINFAAKGVNVSDGLQQAFTPPYVVPSMQFTFSVWLKVASGTQNVELVMQDQPFAGWGSGQIVTATTAWQRFSLTATATSGANNAMSVWIRAPFTTASGAYSVQAFGAQVEYGAAASAYTQTTSATVQLASPNADAGLHGTGFAYFNIGTSVADAAEWKYFGYGFRVWAPKRPFLGIMQVLVDGLSQGTIDLYAAVAANSAVLLTVQNLVLGDHRVRLAPTNTKNAASTNFIVCADAIEVMR